MVFLTLLLVSGLLVDRAFGLPNESQPYVTWSRYLRASDPVLLSDSVVSLTDVPALQDCLAQCASARCHVASWSLTTLVCQLVSAMSLTNALGQPGSSTSKHVEFEINFSVWRVEGLEKLLNISNADELYNKTSKGRSGSVQKALISVTGCYRIEVTGARGGNSDKKTYLGGLGAVASGRFRLTAGTQLDIVVGQAGEVALNESAGAGGGGGSFVYRAAERQLLIAAGGGGGASCSRSAQDGQAGVNGTDSQGGNPENTGLGGTNGDPGSIDGKQNDLQAGGCGAGWLGKAKKPKVNPLQGERGGSLDDGWVGGSAGEACAGEGGFGGGGGGASLGTGGGGGGFSGGGAGTGQQHSGGGGGSFCGGSGCSATTGGSTETKHGRVRLELLKPFAQDCE